MSDITLTLSEPQVRVLYEILNMTGLELTDLDADYGSDSIEDIVARGPECSEINVGRVSQRLFNLLDQQLEHFRQERDA